MPTLRIETCLLRDGAYEASPDEAPVLFTRQPSKDLRSYDGSCGIEIFHVSKYQKRTQIPITPTGHHN